MRKNWTIEKIKEEALKYKTRNEFRKNNNAAYQAAIKKNLLNDICSHMPVDLKIGAKPPNYVWSQEKIISEALQYSTRGQFQIGSPSAYDAALNSGVLDLVCSHMPIHVSMAGNNNPFFKWTKEMLVEEALKYSTRSDFSNNSLGAYTAAHKRKIVDEICSHMKPSRGTSGAERELFSLIKSIYPNAKKIRDMRVKIESKPHIHGFEIDILVGKLGIEYDGKWHHSFEYMRADKGKKLWSDDDIRNYHQLKDDWFATKGIKILHIKEKDWKDNKEACIKLCLSFLGG